MLLEETKSKVLEKKAFCDKNKLPYEQRLDAPEIARFDAPREKLSPASQIAARRVKRSRLPHWPIEGPFPVCN